MKKKIAALEESNAMLVKENSFLIKRVCGIVHVNALNQMKSAIDNQEQYIRPDCLEIRGIPTSAHKDANENNSQKCLLNR